MRMAPVTAREHRPVGLHPGEDVGRANAKQQHTVNGLERVHHPPMRFWCWFETSARPWPPLRRSPNPTGFVIKIEFSD